MPIEHSNKLAAQDAEGLESESKRGEKNARGLFLHESCLFARSIETETDVQSFNLLETKWEELPNGESTEIPVDCFLLEQNQDVRRYEPKKRHRHEKFSPRHTLTLMH